jgi:hypothetical protein
MLVAIEEIEGVKHTIVWHFDDLYPKKNSCEKWKKFQHTWELFLEDCDGLLHIATALPPLPRNPTADDAKLISLYRAHGFYICATENYSEPIENRNPFIIVGSNNDGCFYYQEIFNKEEDGWLDPSIITITHALDEQGNRIEIALKD